MRAFAAWDLNVNVFSWDVPSFVLLSVSFDGVGCKAFCLVCWVFGLTNDAYLFPREYDIVVICWILGV